MRTLLAVLFLSALSLGQTSTAENAEALEAQYKTCAKHVAYHLVGELSDPACWNSLYCGAA